MQADKTAVCGDVEEEWRHMFGRAPPQGVSLSSMRKCARPHEFRAAFDAMADAWGTVKRADTMRFMKAMGWTTLPGFAGGSRRYLQWSEFLHVVEMNLAASEQAGVVGESAGGGGGGRPRRRSKPTAQSKATKGTNTKGKTRAAGNAPTLAGDAVQRLERAARRGTAAKVLRAFCGGGGGVGQSREPLTTPALRQLHQLQERMRCGALSLVQGESKGILRRALKRVTWAPGSITHFSVAHEHECDGRLVARALRLGILRAHGELKRATARQSSARMREARAAAAEALSDAIGGRGRGSGASNTEWETAWAAGVGGGGGSGLEQSCCSNSTAKNGRSCDYLFEDSDFGPTLSAAGLAHTALLAAWVQGLTNGAEAEESVQPRKARAFGSSRVDKQLRVLRKRMDVVERRLSTLVEERRRDGARRLARRQARVAQQQQARRTAGQAGQQNQPTFVSNITAVTAGARGVLRLRSIEAESDSMAGTLPGGATADLAAAAEEVQEQMAEEEEEARACDDLAMLADPCGAAAVFRCAEPRPCSGGSRAMAGGRILSSSFAARDGMTRGLGCGLGLPAPSELLWRRPCSLARWSVAATRAGTGDSCVPSLWGTQSKGASQSDYAAGATTDSDGQGDEIAEAVAAHAGDDDPLDPEPRGNDMHGGVHCWPGLLPPSLSNQRRLAGCHVGGGGVGPCAASPPRQGCLGDGWLLSAMAVLSKRADLLAHACLYYSPAHDTDLVNAETSSGYCVKGSGGVSGSRSNCVSGYAFVRLHSGVRSHFLLIDDRLPARETVGDEAASGSTDSTGAVEVFASCADPSHTWVAILEKAFAKLMGSYEALGTPRRAGQALPADHGAAGDEDSAKGGAEAAMSEATAWALRCLSGLPTECSVIPRLPPQSTLDADAADFMWTRLRTAAAGTMASKSLVYCMRATVNCREQRSDGAVCIDNYSTASSILPWHAYVLLGAAVVDGTRLVRLWNPWWLSGQSTQKVNRTASDVHGEATSPSSSSPPPIAWRWDGEWSHGGRRVHDAGIRQRLARAFGAIETFRFFGGGEHFGSCSDGHGDAGAQSDALCVCCFGAAMSDCDDGTFIMSFDQWRATFSLWNAAWHMPVVCEKKPDEGSRLQLSVPNFNENAVSGGMIAYGPVPSRWQAVQLSYQQWSFEVPGSVTAKPAHTLLLLHRHRRIPYAEDSDTLSISSVAFVLCRERDDGDDRLNTSLLEVVGYSTDALSAGGGAPGPSTSLRARLVPGRYIVQPIADGEVAAPLLLTACSDAGIVRPAVVSAAFAVPAATAGAMSLQSELSSLLRLSDVKPNFLASQAGAADFVLDDAAFRLLDTSSITDRCDWMRRRSSGALVNAVQRQPRLRRAEAEANTWTGTNKETAWRGPSARSVVSPVLPPRASDSEPNQREPDPEPILSEVQQPPPLQRPSEAEHTPEPEQMPDPDSQQVPGLQSCSRSRLREMSPEEVQRRRNDAVIALPCQGRAVPPPVPIPEELLTLLTQHNKQRQSSKLSRTENDAESIPATSSDPDDVPADVRALLVSHARQRGSTDETLEEPAGVEVAGSRSGKIQDHQQYEDGASTAAEKPDAASHIVQEAARHVVDFALANSVSDTVKHGDTPACANEGTGRNADDHFEKTLCASSRQITNSGPSTISSIPGAAANHSDATTPTQGAVIFRGGWQLQLQAQDGSIASRRAFTLATVYELQPTPDADNRGFLLEIVDPSCGGSAVRTVHVDELAVLLEAECAALRRAVVAAVDNSHTKAEGRVMPLADRRPSDDNRACAKVKMAKRQRGKTSLTRWPSHRQSAAAESSLARYVAAISPRNATWYALYACFRPFLTPKLSRCFMYFLAFHARWVVTAGQCVPKRRQLVEWVLARTCLVRVGSTGDDVQFLATIEPLRTAFVLDSGEQAALVSFAAQKNGNFSLDGDVDVDVRPLCTVACTVAS